MFGLGLLSDFSQKALWGAKRPLLRIQRKVAAVRGLPISKGFFDEYPIFFSTSKTRATPNRLNQRYRACIEWNEKLIRGKRILDLASHDGRWSFAAIKAGAKSVIGIEGRDYLVQNAINTFLQQRIPDNSFRFTAGDIFERLDEIEVGSIDTVFLFSIFHHIENHALLLAKIARLRPGHLIIDTSIAIDPNPIVLIWAERTEGEANAAPVGRGSRGVVLAGCPSKTGLDVMLSSFGWTAEYYDWHHAGIRRWDDMVDYQEGRVVTLRVHCQS